jgi:methylglyoxal synthase
MEALQMKLPKAFPEQDHDAHIQAHRAFMATRMVQINPMVYALLQGHISEHVSLKAQGEVGATIANDPNMQVMFKQDPQGAQVQIDAMIANRISQLTMELAQSEAQGQQDPLVALKQRELDLRALDLQRKAQENMLNYELKVDETERKN